MDGRHGHKHVIVRFTLIYAIIAYLTATFVSLIYIHGKVYLIQLCVIMFCHGD
jgi:hypothetical protein